MDGKKIYKKTINFGALPNASNKSVPHGIASLDVVISIEGVATNGTMGLALPFASTNSISNQIQLLRNGANIEISAGVDRSALSCHITIHYTKS